MRSRLAAAVRRGPGSARGKTDDVQRPPFFDIERALEILLESRVKRRLPVQAAGQAGEQRAHFFRAPLQAQQVAHEQLRTGEIHAAVIAVHLRIGRPA